LDAGVPDVLACAIVTLTKRAATMPVVRWGKNAVCMTRVNLLPQACTVKQKAPHRNSSLMSVGGSARLCRLEGLGDGTFAQLPTLTLDSSPSFVEASDVDVADFNRDGTRI
jgi:hypothetical protein